MKQDPEKVKTWQRALADVGFYKGNIDGDFGPATLDAGISLIKKHSACSAEPVPPVVAEPPRELGKMDERSEAIIATLDPHVQDDFRNLGLAINKMIAPRVWKWISGFRGEKEQNALYAKGRTTPGSIVTNARFPYSAHNSGFAADGGVFTAAGAYVDESPEYDVAIKFARSMGFHPGADFGDRPHHCKRPPSCELMTETGFINEIVKRTENGKPLWP